VITLKSRTFCDCFYTFHVSLALPNRDFSDSTNARTGIEKKTLKSRIESAAAVKERYFGRPSHAVLTKLWDKTINSGPDLDAGPYSNVGKKLYTSGLLSSSEPPGSIQVLSSIR
jgi:hypothetical protein